MKLKDLDRCIPHLGNSKLAFFPTHHYGEYLKLLHGVPDAGDIGTNEHEEYIAQDAQNQTKYSQNLDGKGVESSGHPLQRNSRKSDG